MLLPPNPWLLGIELRLPRSAPDPCTHRAILPACLSALGASRHMGADSLLTHRPSLCRPGSLAALSLPARGTDPAQEALPPSSGLGPAPLSQLSSRPSSTPERTQPHSTPAAYTRDGGLSPECAPQPATVLPQPPNLLLPSPSGRLLGCSQLSDLWEGCVTPPHLLSGLPLGFSIVLHTSLPLPLTLCAIWETEGLGESGIHLRSWP